MTSTPISVLVVDDEPDLCTLSKQFLEMSGELKVDVAGSVMDARISLANNRYQAIVSDYQLPDEDGIQFLKSLRASGDHTPFILFTGKGREEVAIEALNNGADAYLQKGGAVVPQYTELRHRIISLVRRQIAEEALIKSEVKYRAYITNSSMPFAVVDASSRYIEVNQAICDLLGYSRQEMLRMAVSQIVTQGEQIEWASDAVTLPGQGQTTQVVRLRRKDGVFISAIIEAVKLPDETNMAFFTDITKLLEFDRKVSRLNRELVAIKECHRAIVRAQTEQDLLDEVCRIVCGVAGYRMAWIGMAENDDIRSVRPVASGGHDHRYVAQINATWGDDDRGCGPTGMCIKTRSPVFIQDFEKDTRMDPWRESALGNGYRSVIGLPLLDSEVVFGAFILYSEEIDGFTTEEIELLKEMATDLAHGIIGLRDQRGREKAEEARAISDARFRTLFEVNNDATLVIDQEDGHVIDVNPAVTRIYGYTKEELIGLDIQSIAPDPKRSWQVHHSNKNFVPIRYHRRKDGTSFPAEITTSNFLINGRTTSMVTVRDITGRLSAEDALRESEKRFQNMADNTFEGIWISVDGIITDVNRTLADMLGYRPNELIGGKLFDLFTSESINIVRDLRKSESSGSYEVEIIKKNGEILNVQIRDKNIIWKGKASRFGAILDITAQKRTEMALRASEDKFRSIFECSPVAIAISRDSVTTYINPPFLEMFGFSSSEELIGHSLFDQIAPQCREEIQDRIHRRFQGQALDNEFETMGMHKDGSLFPFRIVVSQVKFDGAWALIGFFTEITKIVKERNKAERALERAYLKLNLLSSITRHDINYLTTAIKGHLALLMLKYPELESDEDLKNVDLEAEQISSMIRFTKEYEDIGINEPIWHDIRALIGSGSRYILTGSVEIFDDVPSGIMVYADPLIIRVFHNLIQNAVRHDGATTFIHFYLEKRKERTAIICEDDGLGISQEIKSELFTKGVGKDHGFGLFLSREILAITAITITEEGEPGKGAKFVLTLPQDGVRGL